MSDAPPPVPPKPAAPAPAPKTEDAPPPVPPKPAAQQQQSGGGWGSWFGWGSKPAAQPEAEKPKEEAQPAQQQQQQSGGGWGSWFGWGSSSSQPAQPAPPSPQIEPLDPAVFPYTGSIPLGKIGERDITKAKNCYWETSSNHFVVRSKSYLTDRVKVESAPSICRLVSADLLRSKTKLRSYASTPDYPTQAHPDKQFIVVNWTVPTTVPLTFSECFLIPEETEENKVGLSLLKRYMSAEESDDFRNNRLKLIPNIVEGPWVVKSAVGKTPAIIGNKLTTTYYRGKNFFEVNIDVGSSYIASGIWGLVSSYVTSLVIDLGLVIQANEVEDLPEHIFGVIRVVHVDLAGNYIKEIPDSYVDVPEVVPPVPPKPAAPAPAPAAAAPAEDKEEAAPKEDAPKEETAPKEEAPKEETPAV